MISNFVIGSYACVDFGIFFTKFPLKRMKDFPLRHGTLNKFCIRGPKSKILLNRIEVRLWIYLTPCADVDPTDFTRWRSQPTSIPDASETYNLHQLANTFFLFLVASASNQHARHKQYLSKTAFSLFSTSKPCRKHNNEDRRKSIHGPLRPPRSCCLRSSNRQQWKHCSFRFCPRTWRCRPSGT